MRRSFALAIPAMLAVLLSATACGGNSAPQSLPTPDASGSIDTGAPSETPPPSVVTVTVTQGGGGGGGSSWPSPEDCISYNPNNVSYDDLNNDGFTWIVKAGSAELVRVMGAEESGVHAANVAKRYKKVCFIGRNNGRPASDKAAYIYEYWRDPSGINSPLPDAEDACFTVDRNNLTINSMDEDGWRVLDHNEPLAYFDTRQEAENGKLVLSKYSQYCAVQSESEDSIFEVKITYTR